MEVAVFVIDERDSELAVQLDQARRRIFLATGAAIFEIVAEVDKLPPCFIHFGY